MRTNRRDVVLGLIVPILVTVTVILVGVSVGAQTVDFEAFWVKSNGSASENVHEDGANFVTPAAGDKAGYGTHYLDGQPLSSLQSIDWVKDHGSDTSIPYPNIWFTDGTNYAITAPQHVGDPEYEYRASKLPAGEDIGDLYVKVYEYQNLGWMTPGATTREGAGYLLNNGVRVTFGQLASYGHTIQDPGTYGTWVGAGAPKNGTGLNIIYGDTKSNYVGGYNIKYLTLNGIATAVPVTFTVASDGSGDYTTIQGALDAAYNGDTINVVAGTYEEQALIDKDLVLEGEPGASIKSPGSQTYTIAESSSTFDPIVFAYGGTMVGDHVSGPGVINTDVKGLDIDGQNNASPGTRFVAILYRNVDGTISGNTIHDMGINGIETFGIMVYGDSDVNISDNDISGYSKGGITANGDSNGLNPPVHPSPYAVIENNTVTGPGLGVPVTYAPNGIQIGWGATGEIRGNTVSGHGWPGSAWTGSGILVFLTDGVIVEQNTAVGNETGVAVAGYMWNPAGLPATNTIIRQNDILNNEYGISVQDKSIDTVIERNVISGNADGIDICNFYGDPPTGTQIHYNSIAGNNPGALAGYGGLWVASGVPTVNATLNWWGSLDGPTEDADQDGSPEYNGGGDWVLGSVIFSPWLGIDPDGNPTMVGVQLVSPMLIIVDDVGPAPAAGYLNTAVDASNTLAGLDTIEVRHGTYDTSTPITEAVNIVSEPGSALHTTLNGNMSINGNGVLIGDLPLQGFRVNGNVTVEAGNDAATSWIHWCDLYGNVTNNGTGTFDAQYNYWGTLLESVVDSRTTGAIDYEPFLPKNADDSYVDATAIINAGLASGMDPAIDQLWLMVQLGQDVSTFIGYAGVAGAGAFAGAPAGAAINLGGAAGGGGAVEGAISGTYTPGDPIDGRFTLTDPVTGEPITDAAVTTSLLGPDGALVFWGCATYDETTGEYVFTIDTSGLAPGTYELIIQTDDGQSKTVSIEVLAA